MKRIKQISVKNLFGMFDHTIPLNMDERITIIHGPNGFGKTAILRLLNSLFSQDNSALHIIPFGEFRVDFEDGTDLRVSTAPVPPNQYKDNPYFSLITQSKIIFHFFDSGQKEVIVSPKKPPINIGRRVGLPGQSITNASVEGDPKERDNKVLLELRQSISLRLIETQRLQGTISETVEGYERSYEGLSVMAYSVELAQIIETKLAESTTLSQSLDRTFPSRLVNPTTRQKSFGVDEIRSKLIALESKRQYLMATGLLDQEGADAIQVQEQDQIDESTKVVLSVYAEDTEKKLGIFDELANKIDLLKRIINKRFLYKEMTISKERGFIFTNAKGIMLSPDDLSSGEQHELILFYELLFKVAPGSLILIDEPEISLHVVWQEQFLEDVLAVTRLSNIDVLLATHSPDIIAGRRDLMVELKGPE
jgi:predicted ATP-binding protein involved in virulence